MKLHCNQTDLSKALSLVRRAVASRATLAILGNILLEAKGQELRLAATNLQFSIDCWIAADITKEGAITVPARLLAEMVGKLPGGKVSLELSERTQTLQLTCGAFAAKLAGLPAYDFPQSEPLDDPVELGVEGTALELDATMLGGMLDTVVLAAARDQSRQNLTCVQVQLGERLKLAATDGFRLSTRAANLEVEAQELELLIPAASMAELGSLLAHADTSASNGKPLKLYIPARRNRVSFGITGKDGLLGATLAAQLMDAKYPDYQAIIPKSATTTVTVGAAALLRALQVARLFSKADFDAVTLCADPASKRLIVSAADASMGNSSDALEAEVEGKEITIMLDNGFLIEMLGKLGDTQVLLEMTQPSRPMMLRPTHLLRDEFVYVVMPMNRGK